MTEITSVRETPIDRKQSIWENLGYVALALTIVGQILVGIIYLAGQGCWLASNAILISRNVALHRPKADMVKDCCMTAITTGLIVASLLGVF